MANGIRRALRHAFFSTLDRAFATDDGRGIAVGAWFEEQESACEAVLAEFVHGQPGRSGANRAATPADAGRALTSWTDPW